MNPMNYLVYLDTSTGELEKILSGIKCMLIKELDPVQTAGKTVCPGDNLYFLRSKDNYDLRVKANVTRVLSFTNIMDEEISQALKEFQPRLQLTEDQYYYWSEKQQVLLVEFECAHKIEAIHIASIKVADQSDWIGFKELDEIT
jgi:hypothetical protein